MTLVLDASVAVSAFVDSGPTGEWAQQLIESQPLAAPAHMLVEAANILRRAAMAGDLPDALATQAQADLLDLRADFYPYPPLAERIWELRHNVTPYDGWYVALAEALGAGLATLDLKLAAAAGPRCRFVIPVKARRSKLED